METKTKIALFVGACCAAIALVVLITSCGASQDRVVTEDVQQCAVLCLAVAGAQCWGAPNIAQGLNTASSLATCLNACEDTPELITSLDLGCLQDAKDCEQIDKCVEFKVSP